MNLTLLIIAGLALSAESIRTASGDSGSDDCNDIHSCSSCISREHCMWCVTKSKCTSQSCGNDNIIHPTSSSGLMIGPHFCPRIVEPEGTLTLKSGKDSVLSIKMTQLHLYMAFTPWKCKVSFDGLDMMVSAVLIEDSVFCKGLTFTNKLHVPYTNGSVSVMWDSSKTIDGSLQFTVCRCDLDPICIACR